MSDPAPDSETLEEFARSLSYGSRSDLSFKFMRSFDPQRIGDSVAAILNEVGGLFDTGDPAALVDLAIRLQAEAYQMRAVSERYRYDEGPFTKPSRPVADSEVVLLTSSGHFVSGDDPRPLGVSGMDQDEAEARIGEFLREAPTLSEIPVDTEAGRLVVRHGGYDVRGSAGDHNVSFPVDRLRELVDDGLIGGLHDTAYSFVGACAQTRLLRQTGPEWADRLAATGSDIILLVPV